MHWFSANQNWVRLPTKCLLIKRVPKGTAASPANRRFIMTNHLCYPTLSVKSFRPDFGCTTDCGAVSLAGLHSKSEWNTKKNGVLVPSFSLESPLVQNPPLKSTFMRKNTPLPKKLCLVFKTPWRWRHRAKLSKAEKRGEPGSVCSVWWQ